MIVIKSDLHNDKCYEGCYGQISGLYGRIDRETEEV